MTDMIDITAHNADPILLHLFMTKSRFGISMRAAAMDPLAASSLGIMKLLERSNRTGTTVLVATHDREMVDSLRRRVIALEHGHVVRDDQNGGYGYYGAL